MSVDQIIMWVMAFGLLLGGLDKIIGNRFGLGEKFDEGYQAMGPLALGMVGIVCLTPIIQSGIEKTIAPLFIRMNIDPAMIGTILANDMGGYQLCMELAVDQRAGLLAGAIVASMLGVVIVFHIPVGLGLIDKEKHPYFAEGLLIGIITIPLGSTLGGVAAGFPISMVLINMVPVFILAILLAAGIKWMEKAMIKGFLICGKVIVAVAYIGLMAAGFQYITGVVIIPGMTPIEDSLQIVAGIAVVLSGTFPVLEILMRILKKPLSWVGSKLHLDSVSTAAFIFGLANAVPVFTMMKKMNKRGVVIVTAWTVTASAAFGDHLGFTANVQPKMIGPMIVGKISAGILAVLLAVYLQRNEQVENNG